MVPPKRSMTCRPGLGMLRSKPGVSTLGWSPPALRWQVSEGKNRVGSVSIQRSAMTMLSIRTSSDEEKER